MGAYGNLGLLMSIICHQKQYPCFHIFSQNIVLKVILDLSRMVDPGKYFFLK